MSIKGISNWAILGGTAGGIFSIISFVQYYLLYPDHDRLIAYTTIGVLVVAVSWLYQKALKQGNEITAIEDYLDDKFRQGR